MTVDEIASFVALARGRLGDRSEATVQIVGVAASYNR
jgi:hypothetical protein